MNLANEKDIVLVLNHIIKSASATTQLAYFTGDLPLKLASQILEQDASQLKITLNHYFRLLEKK